MDRLASQASTAAAGSRGDPRNTAENAFTKHGDGEGPDERERGRARGRAEHSDSAALARERPEARERDQPLAHEAVQGRQPQIATAPRRKAAPVNRMRRKRPPRASISRVPVARITAPAE